MSDVSIQEFIEEISTPQLEGMFNPWSQSCASEVNSEGYLDRRERLHRHLKCPQPRILIIGEASGYQGCRFSGLAFTSERLLVEGAIPRMPDMQGERITRRERPWSEPSATIVWGVLYEIGLAENTVMFNAVPWHPEGNKGPFSNRTPTTAEKEYGRIYLKMFLGLYPHVPIIALGKTASVSLSEAGIEHIKIRHPANGGAAKFREGMKRFMKCQHIPTEVGIDRRCVDWSTSQA